MINRVMKYSVQTGYLMPRVRDSVHYMCKGMPEKAAICYADAFRTAKNKDFTPSMTHLAINQAVAESIKINPSLKEKGTPEKLQAFNEYVAKNINSKELKPIKDFQEQYAKLYPKTAQKREMLINSGKVKLPKLDDYTRFLGQFGEKGLGEIVWNELSLKKLESSWYLFLKNK